MTNDVHIIETDEYLDLSNFNLCVQEFKDTLDKIPNDYINVGQFTPDISVDDEVDSKLISLRIYQNYEDRNDWALIDKEERFEDGTLYELFPKIKKFVSALPFESIGRTFISFTKNKTNVTPHAGFTPKVQKTWRQEFLWFNLIGNKRMWSTNYDNTLEFYENNFVVEDRFEKVYSKGISCWFNPLLLHGVDCGEDISASLRVDGEYTKEFRKKIFGDDEWKTEFTYVDEKPLRRN
jgi:hypothetical protein|tara:strand:- start:207 stop:914 length:708 start_codon:yes stop_codon:yes gene_type:complete